MPISYISWSYANANPIRYTDPSGYKPICFNIGGESVCIGLGIGPFFGKSPDWRGIQTVERYMSPDIDSIEVDAGIEVQSQWYGLWDTRTFAPSSSSGLGIAQVNDEQMKSYELEGLNQMEPSVALLAMERRIELVQEECPNCCARDDLIVAAMAQNGPGFDTPDIGDVLGGYIDENGYIDWRDYFDYRGKPSALEAKLRQFLTGNQYDTEFMLLLYTNDLRELHQRGWSLPGGITEADLDYMEALAKGGD